MVGEIDKSKEPQMALVYEAFHGEPRTMLDVSLSLGVFRANVCRYVAKWREEGKITLCREGIDSITGCKAGFYSTDRSFFPSINNKS